MSAAASCAAGALYMCVPAAAAQLSVDCSKLHAVQWCACTGFHVSAVLYAASCGGCVLVAGDAAGVPGDCC